MADIPVYEGLGETLATATTNGQAIFAYTFLAFDETQVMAEFRPASGPAIPLTLNTNYTVSGLNQPNGGSITLVGVAVSVGDQIYMYRETPIEREKDWQNEGDYKADLVNREQDEIYMIMQELKRGTSNLAIRSALFQPGYMGSRVLPSPAAGLILGWSQDELSLRNYDVRPQGGLIVGEAGQQVLEQDTFSEIRELLDIKDRMFDSVSAASVAVIPGDINFILTAGYYGPGLGGAGLYKRVASEPSHAGKFQSSDGAWWEIDPQSANPLSFGARGRGMQSDAAEDTAGVSSFLDYVFLPTSVVLVADLKGRCYVMQSGWSLPAGSTVKNKRVTNGKFQVSLASSGDFYILDFSTNGWTTEFRVDDIAIRGDNPSDGTDVKLLGGIKFGDCAVVFADKLNIVGFTESGVKQTSPNFGQALYVSNSQVFGDFAGAFASRTTTNIAIDIAGGDIAIRGCQIGNANQLVRFRNNSNKITDCHVFQYTNTSNTGIVCDKAHGMQITNNYIDTCNLILSGEASLSFNYWDNIINDNRFYCPPMFVPGAFFSFIWVNPKKVNTSVNNMQINNNSFCMEPVGSVASIAVSTAEGTIDPLQISGFSMRGNTFYGVSVKTSHPSLEIVISSSTTGSVDAASLIPFGNIGYIKSAAWEAGAPVGYSISKSGTTVTATMSVGVSGVMHIEATVNTTSNP